MPRRLVRAGAAGIVTNGASQHGSNRCGSFSDEAPLRAAGNSAGRVRGGRATSVVRARRDVQPETATPRPRTGQVRGAEDFAISLGLGRPRTVRLRRRGYRPSGSIGQRETQRLELQRHVDRLHDHVAGHGELHRGDVEDRLRPRAHQPVHHLLRRLGRGDDDGDVAGLLGEVGVQVADVADHETVPAGADFLRILVVNRGDVEAALPEAGILYQRAADPAGANQHDAVRASQAQDVANPRGELRDRVAQTALAERAEEREVLAHLRRGGAAAAGQLGGGDGGLALRVELLEEPEVQGEPSHGALGDLPHCELFHNRTLQRKSRTNISGASVSGRAAASSPSAASPAVTTAAERPVAAITTLRSCLRRRVKQAVTNARKAAISSGATTGCTSGVRRTTALVTLGGGVNAPARTVKSRSTRATACTPTDRAPYVLDPGDAAIRSATSAWTRNTIRAGRGGVRALSISGEVMAYGILPITLNAGCEMRDAGCVASETSACQSRRSESPSTTVTLPGSRISHPASRIPATSRRSRSMAMT